jgi:hypothetical protein
LDYYTGNKYADAVFAQIFEGIPQKRKWSYDEIEKVNQTEKFTVLDPWEPVRWLMISKLILKPISEIIQIGSRGIRDSHIPFHRLYSAHDTQIGNLLA